MTTLTSLLNESNDSIVIMKSEVDSTFTLYIIYKENPLYDKFSLVFERFGHAFLQSGTKNIFVDGEELEESYFTKNHLIAIQGHEIAHSVLKHGRGLNKQLEMEADIAGMEILKKKGKTSAYFILKKRFNSLYKKEPSMSLLGTKSQQLLQAYL